MSLVLDKKAADRRDAEQLLRTLPPGDLLLRYQRRAVDALMANRGMLVIEKSRRIGLTWAVAAFAALRAGSQASAGGDDVWYMGYDAEMAEEFIQDCAMWARAFNIAAGAVGETVIEDVDEEGKSRNIRGFRIVMASGLRVISLASSARKFRGRQGTIVLDEMAFHDDVAGKIAAAGPYVIWGGSIVVVSTHKGVSNAFNTLVDDVRAGVQEQATLLTITFDDAVADGLYERVRLTGKHRGLEKEAWVQSVYAISGKNADEELRCIPGNSAGALITPEALAACEHPDAGKPELYAGGLFIVGRDVARWNDGQIIWGFELVGDVLWLRERWEGVGQTFQAQSDAADAMIAGKRLLAYWLDEGGMGEQPVEEAKRRYGETRVAGQKLQGPNRLDIALSLAQRFERGLIRIPPDPVIRADLRAIVRLPTSGGGIRIADDPEGKVHADRFWAAALASRAADLPPVQYEYRSCRPPSGPAIGRARFSMRPDTSDDWRPESRRGTW